jgi:hypothetical protein
MRISATWIDEDGRGETADFGELWQRLEEEIKSSTALLLYVEPDDFPLKGALVEVGMAIAMGKPVLVFHPGVEIDQVTYRPLGSWIKHPGVVLMTSCIEDWAHPAVPVAAPAVPKEYSVLRFRHGKRMAEGARVTASCEDEALDKARRLFYPLEDGERFEIRAAMEAQGERCPNPKCRSYKRSVRNPIPKYVLGGTTTVYCDHEWHAASVPATALPSEDAALGTERTMHAAWRKRAEQAEKELEEVRHELLCVDDIKLDQPLVGIISDLQKDRDYQRSEKARLRAQLHGHQDVAEHLRDLTEPLTNEQKAVINELANAARPSQGVQEKCSEFAGILLAGHSSFACALPKGHDPSTHPAAVNGHLRGGRCFKHGEYTGDQCPQWPKCIPGVQEEAGRPQHKQSFAGGWESGAVGGREESPLERWEFFVADEYRPAGMSPRPDGKWVKFEDVAALLEQKGKK